MKLNEHDLENITAALTLVYLYHIERPEFRDQCAELHDRIQIIRRKNGTFESVD